MRVVVLDVADELVLVLRLSPDALSLVETDARPRAGALVEFTLPPSALELWPIGS